jgi:uncharacterized membrane protein
MSFGKLSHAIRAKIKEHNAGIGYMLPLIFSLLLVGVGVDQAVLVVVLTLLRIGKGDDQLHYILNMINAYQMRTNFRFLQESHKAYSGQLFILQINLSFS